MSTTARNKKLLRSMLVVVLVSTGIVAAHAWMRLVSQSPTSNAEDISGHLAATADRDARSRAETQLAVEIARNGFEPNSAGYHLVRPPDDMLWSAPYGPLTPSGGHHWGPIRVYYSDVEYQRRMPVEIEPQPNLGTCVVSHARAIPNSLGQATVQSQPDGRFSVIVTFVPRSLLVLQRMLNPRSTHADGSFVDWFGTAKLPGENSTVMVLVVASNRIAFLPINASTLVAQGTTSAQAIVARDLDATTANELVSKLNTP